MSVQPGPTDKRYAANGVSTIYTVPFLVIEAGDLNVYLNDVLMTSGYTHAGIGDPTSTLTFTTPPLGDLYLLLDVPFQRLTDYQENGDLLAETLNRDFDRIWQALKQLYGWAIRSLRLGAFDIDGQGSYRANGNSITGLASAGTDASAATNLKDVRDYVASVLETGQGPVNNAANVVYVRPFGVAGSVQDLATGEGYDYVGATLPTGVFSTVKGFFNWILDRITLSTSGSASIVAAVAKGGKVVIKTGVHYMSAPAVCDYGVDPVVGFPGHASKRYDIEGESPGGSIISNQHSDFAFKFSGSSPMTQNFGGFDRIGNLTIVGPNVTAPNTDNSGGAGIVISNKTRTEVYNLNFQNLSLGMELNDVVTSTMRNVNIGGCFAGIRGGPTLGITGPNAMHWTNTRVANTWGNAIDMAVGACLTFDGLTLEGNGTPGFPHTGLLLTARASDIASTINLFGLYAELNAVVADIYVNNTSGHTVILNVEGSMFARVDATRYALTHIQANSSGGGKVTVNLGNPSRFVAGFGYVPTAGRPFWTVGAHCEVVWDENCSFSETTSLVYWLCLNRDYSFTIAANGTILAGPDGFACTSLGGGHYRLYRTSGLAEFAKFADDVAVKVTPGAGGFTSYIPTKTTSAIDIQLHNGGAAGDAKFDISIKRVNGYYA